MQFLIGQRWLSSADSSLGLGIVVETDGRNVTLNFPAIGEDRTYAKSGAPLHRLLLQPGDEATTSDGSVFTVTSTETVEGVSNYMGKDESNKKIIVSEIELNPHLSLVTPLQRMLTGSLDKSSHFILRVKTLKVRGEQQQRSTRGLMGGRTSLLPHQIYIANEIGSRYAPRVLLADEVGLGKTIEAGMILHQQLITGRSERILLIVPDSLVHQWLVEMLRRFNLKFSIFNMERLAHEETSNPFEAEQLVLCGNSLFSESNEAREWAVIARWDIVLIDEAHHEMWSTVENANEENIVERLSKQSAGLLLLTATPEQNTKSGHFERLKLLDPNRFFDYEQFKKDQSQYIKLGKLVERLEKGDRPSSLPPGIDPKDSPDLIVSQLIDLHGTGRIFMRNSRSNISGFPRRQLIRHALDDRTQGNFQVSNTSGESSSANFDENENLLKDPRVSWLEDTLRQMNPLKVLVICSDASTAITLERHLHLRAGIRSAAFHEKLDLIERDRAAAYFAESNIGAQCLICSEIGSEGRNFQFSHNLILFDLPLNPDLLEQRIGRLDRIGQTNDINIHVPYVTGSAQHSLLEWHEKGLSIFSKVCPFGAQIFDKYGNDLKAILDGRSDELEKLCKETKIFRDKLEKDAQQGKDKLLERSSCRSEIAKALIDTLHAEENSEDLQVYLEQLCAAYGVHHEYHSEACWTLKPTDSMQTNYFPHLPEHGMTITVDRSIALAREDLSFMTWEHPMVTDCVDMILSTEFGNTSIGTLKLKSIESGTMLLEVFFSASCAAPKYLMAERFLPESPIRLLINQQGNDISDAISHAKLNDAITKIRRETGAKIVQRIRDDIEDRVKVATIEADKQLVKLKAEAGHRVANVLGYELERLEALRSTNQSIRGEEIELLQNRIDKTHTHIEAATLVLQAIRVIIIS